MTRKLAAPPSILATSWWRTSPQHVRDAFERWPPNYRWKRAGHGGWWFVIGYEDQRTDTITALIVAPLDLGGLRCSSVADLHEHGVPCDALTNPEKLWDDVPELPHDASVS